MNEQNKHWLIRKTTIRKLWIGLYISLGISLLLELLIDSHKRFGEFGIDTSFGFSAWFGFIGCLLMVIFAKLLGFLIKRPDNYYDDHKPSTIVKQDSTTKGHHD
ncbi:hypothetical protein MNBD_GAMMA12-132 [hydrothermal vent metagenome]|uniref:Uncharacterized protein n=1 Tax=hydrothermal vent metagenome TaxID=652676 RepID=A0A3B0YFC8_9ZZZZ